MHAQTHLRIARPVSDPAAAERFHVAGLGLTVLYRQEATEPDEHDLLMVGMPDGAWHLELVGSANLAVRPTPTPEDLLVLYLDGPVDPALVDRCVEAGGTVVSTSPYWDRWGVTIADPDGYRYVLCTRSWQNKVEPGQPQPRW
ncbi:VOC family protein [Micromonospora sp. NPDC003197]